MAIGFGNSWGFENVQQQTQQPSLQDLQAENQKLLEQLQQARAQNHSLSNQNQQQQTAFQQHLTGQNQQQDDLLNFSWTNAQQQLQQPSSPQLQAPTNKSQTAIQFKSQEELNSYLGNFYQEQRQKEAQVLQQANAATSTLQERFIKEHPDLLPHAKLVGDLWNDSLQLNPGIPAIQRYQGVINRVRSIVGNPQQQQKQQMPYGSLTPNATGQNPLYQQQIQQQQNASDEYNREEHEAELAARQKWVRDRMFS